MRNSPVHRRQPPIRCRARPRELAESQPAHPSASARPRSLRRRRRHRPVWRVDGNAARRRGKTIRAERRRPAPAPPRWPVSRARSRGSAPSASTCAESAAARHGRRRRRRRRAKGDQRDCRLRSRVRSPKRLRVRGDGRPGRGGAPQHPQRYSCGNHWSCAEAWESRSAAPTCVVFPKQCRFARQRL